MDLTGKKLFTKSYSANENIVSLKNMNDFTAGFYLLKIKFDEGSATKKLLKK
jgi:hypothetical protein